MQNKYSGKVSDFQPVVEDQSRVVISYGLTELGDGKAEWFEVVFYKKQTAKPTIEQVKKSVLEDINKQTDEKILTGFVWNDMPVYLSDENQRNFSEAQRIAMIMPDAILPVTFKLGEQADETPIYYEFTTSEELTGFYLQAVSFINQTLAEGWQRKDGIDWAPYEAALNPQPEQTEGTKKSTRKK